MAFLTLGTDGNELQFDTSRQVFGWNGFAFSLQETVSFSETVPWQMIPFVFEDRDVTGTQMVFHGKDENKRCRLTFALDPDGFLQGELIVEALKKMPDFACFVHFPIPANARMTMPMSLYNNNPSTAKDRIVPRFPESGEAALVLEESRFPIPGVNAEFGDSSLLLFLLPGNGCSIGAKRDLDGKTFCLISSGCVAFNGVHDVVYKQKCRAVPEAKGYRNLQPGEVFSMRFVLHYEKMPRSGEGFRDLVRSGWKLLKPEQDGALNLDEVIRRKCTALDDRWHQNGYLCVRPDNLYKLQPYFLYGWTGQGVRLALCDIRRGVLEEAPEYVERGLDAVRFFAENAAAGIPGLYHLRYTPELNLWSPGENLGNPVFSARAMGETFSDIARIMLFCRGKNISYPASFEKAVRAGFDFMLTHLLPQGITPVVWHQDGSPGSAAVTSAGTSMLTGLLTMFRLTEEKYFLDQALALLERYWQLGGNHYDTPFSHATLDSGCEDKEAAVPFFNAAAEAWRLTGKEQYKQWAESSGDWLLTWVYFWDVPFDKRSICGHYGFRTTGWPAVSVENQHLDVFFPAWEMYLFGKETGNGLFARAGEMVFKAWSQGISTGDGNWLMPGRGMQAEQFFQTDWCFSMEKRFDNFPVFFREQLQKFGYGRENIDFRNPNGGCNPWEISWIISLVLEAALSFKEANEAE